MFNPTSVWLGDVFPRENPVFQLGRTGIGKVFGGHLEGHTANNSRYRSRVNAIAILPHSKD